MKNLKNIDINNLTIKRVEIDIVANKLIVVCIDKTNWEKSYYKNLDNLEYENYEKNIIDVVKNGKAL